MAAYLIDPRVSTRNISKTSCERRGEAALGHARRCGSGLGLDARRPRENPGAQKRRKDCCPPPPPARERDDGCRIGAKKDKRKHDQPRLEINGAMFPQRFEGDAKRQGYSYSRGALSNGPSSRGPIIV